MKKIKFTIAIPTFNRLSRLKKAIDSVLSVSSGWRNLTKYRIAQAHHDKLTRLGTPMGLYLSEGERYYWRDSNDGG